MTPRLPLDRPPPRLLIIEDDFDIGTTLEEVLGTAGYEVVLTRSGEEGLERLLAGNFDCIVMDWLMPGIGGAGFYREAVVQHLLSCPVILITAARLDSIPRDIAEHCLKVMAKPFELAEFEAGIREALKINQVVVGHGRTGPKAEIDLCDETRESCLRPEHADV